MSPIKFSALYFFIIYNDIYISLFQLNTLKNKWFNNKLELKFKVFNNIEVKIYNI